VKRPSTRLGMPIVLGGYSVGLAWLLLNDAHAHPAGSAGARALTAFVLPSAAAFILWALDTLESKRPVYAHAPGDRVATINAVLHIVTFIVALHLLVLWQTLGFADAGSWALHGAFVLVGGLLISVGNLLPTTRPNLFVGVRTRRTLHDRELWLAANRMAGPASVALGVVLIASALVLQSPHVGPVSMVATLVALASVVVRYRRLAQSRRTCAD
jgi:hypothetical protein